MEHFRNLRLDSPWLLFFVFLAMIHGVSWGFADSYDHMSVVDVQTYVGLSEFDWDQHPVRRYRVIVPMLAAGVQFVLGPILSAVSPQDFPGDFATIMSFLIVNNLLMSIYGLLVFYIVRSTVISTAIWPALMGVTAVLTSRWTAYIAGSALVDSLFLVTIGLLLLGVLKKKLPLLILVIYLGPWAKESFIFFVPLLMFVDKKLWLRLGIHLLISGVIVFGFRYWFDQTIGADFGASISRDVSHFGGIPDSLRRLFSVHGAYELMSIGGAWNVFLVFGLFVAKIRKALFEKMNVLWWLFLGSILFQALLSQELARMFYMAAPLLAVMVAVFFEELVPSSPKA